jgi:hypothetical protein
MKAEQINNLFKEAIKLYHVSDHVDSPMPDIQSISKFEQLLFHKNWIDTVQWHLEDLIRDPKIAPETIVALKRRIDASNQHRTDKVEEIDEYLYKSIEGVTLNPNARLNSETPAWLLDRMSILQLKIYHFQEQQNRSEIDENHKISVTTKLSILLIQEQDLAQSYDELIEDLEAGKKYMKLYKQMKMYNDPNLNPVLYKKND